MTILFLSTTGYSSKAEWSSPIHALPGGGPNLPIMSPNPYLLSRFTSNIPMPTLYAGDSVRKPKLSVIEVLLYNMAALLAGVAAGYDVRMSNISPVHPTLLSDVPALKGPINDIDYPMHRDEQRFISNTYHGPARHNRLENKVPVIILANFIDLLLCCFFRMALNPRTFATADDSPILRRTDEITAHQHHTNVAPPSINMGGANFYQHIPSSSQATPHQQQPSTISTTSGLGSNFTTNTSAMLSSSLGSSNTQPPTPSPRRKISSSSFTENVEYSDQNDTPPSQHLRLFKGFRIGNGGVDTPPFYAPNDYLRNGPSFSNDGGAYGAGAHRTGYFGK